MGTYATEEKQVPAGLLNLIRACYIGEKLQQKLQSHTPASLQTQAKERNATGQK